MKHILFLLCMALLFTTVACDKIEIPSNDHPQTEGSGGDNGGDNGGDDDKGGDSDGSDNGGDDDDNGGDTPSDKDYISVADLADIPTDRYVAVRAYIVGYVKGSSIKGTVFGADGAVASNIAVADSPDETDYNRCAPVQLPTNSDVRYFLNLQDNPENLGKEVVLFGNKTTYFRTNGIKPCMDFMYAEEYDDSH